MFTFFLAVCALLILRYAPQEKSGKEEASLTKKKKTTKKRSISILSILLRSVGFILILALAHYTDVDYGIYGILTVSIFYVFKNRKLSLFFFAIMNVLFFILNIRFDIRIISQLQIYSIISIMFLKNYDPEDTLIIPWKYAFYIYYPLHMLLLVVIKLYTR
jgi:hypothetical protein